MNEEVNNKGANHRGHCSKRVKDNLEDETKKEDEGECV